MSISIACHHCGQSVKVSEDKYAELKGKSAKCKNCGHTFVIRVEEQQLPALRPEPEPIRAAVVPAFPSHQCVNCGGWFDVNQVYSVNGGFICKGCHERLNSLPPPVAQAIPIASVVVGYGSPFGQMPMAQMPMVQTPMGPMAQMPMGQTQPVIIQNVINNVVGNRAAPRWNRGIAAILSFLIPGLGQMYKGQVINGVAWFVVVFIGYMFLILPGLVLHLCCIIGAACGDEYR